MNIKRITPDDFNEANQYCKELLREYNYQQKRLNMRFDIVHEDIDDIQEIYSVDELKSKKKQLEKLLLLWKSHYNSSYSRCNIEIIRARQFVLTLRINRIQAWLNNLNSENFEYAYITNIGDK